VPAMRADPADSLTLDSTGPTDDVCRPLVPDQLVVEADDSVARRLGELARTEDVAPSPDGRRLAIAGYERNEIFLVECRTSTDRVVAESVTATTVEGLCRPHGLAFLDDRTLVVANRESELLLVMLDEPTGTRPVAASVLLDGSHPVPVRSPGSVVAQRLTSRLVEITVCNNFAHDVTRYVLDRACEWRIVFAERLLARDLAIPDGVALSGSGTWIAVSNHERNLVHVYRNSSDLGPHSAPEAVLTGVNYPHGLRFVGEDVVVVADAGLPYVHTFVAEGGWCGERPPAQSTRVMDDATFHRGRSNPQEGGPKGLAVVGDVVALTSEFQPLAFFALRDLGVPSEPNAPHDRGRPDVSVPPPDERVILRMAAAIDESRAARAAASERATVAEDRVAEATARVHELVAQLDSTSAVAARAEAAERDRHAAGVEIARLMDREQALVDHIDLVHRSTSWRVSAPVRWAARLLRSLRR
jgi:hypothetical protein